VSDLYEFHERPDLDSPVLLVALEGWIDAGLSAQRALECIRSQLDPVTVATFDTDRLLDHRARRPAMRLVDGVHGGLTWPSIELLAATDHSDNEFLLLIGSEPDHVWRAFSSAVVDLALEFGTRLVVGLGAYPAPAPHTRPTQLASTATNAELADRVGHVDGDITVPAGVQAAIEDRCSQVGLPAVGLWAQVPHYAAAMPYPGGALALVEGLVNVSELDLGTLDLADEAAASKRRLDQLVANSDEHQELVRQLEAQVDAAAASDQQANDGAEFGPIDEGTTGELPSADELAAEVERFLRDQSDD
jgi:hypothetical protein